MHLSKSYEKHLCLLSTLQLTVEVKREARLQNILKIINCCQSLLPRDISSSDVWQHTICCCTNLQKALIYNTSKLFGALWWWGFPSSYPPPPPPYPPESLLAGYYMYTLFVKYHIMCLRSLQMWSPWLAKYHYCPVKTPSYFLYKQRLL